MFQRAQLYLLRHRLLAIGAVLMLALLIVGVGVAVAYAGRTPAQGQNCGTVQASANGLINPAAARQAENCFWQAFQTCSPATLAFSKMGVDTVLTHTFTITGNNGKCAISDTVQNGGPDAVPTPPRTYTCAGLTQQADGLHFTSCGADGDILVPAA
jgi:hypothetical protein